MKLIPLNKSSNCRCHFCDSTESVKYLTKVYDPVVDFNLSEVCICSKCVDRYMIRKEA